MTAAGLKDLFERKRRAILKRPSFAHATGQARLRLRDGLRCEVEEGELAHADRSGGGGGRRGDRAAPRAGDARGHRRLPGDGLSAVGRAPRRGDRRDRDRRACCETDVRGQLGIADVPIGWHRIMVDVCITSAAPEADVRRVVETADRLSPLLANLSPAIERVHRLAHRSPRRRPDMDTRVFRRVQRYGWDAATDAYDRGWVPLLERLTTSCVERAALRPGERVLDLATGTGRGRVRGGALAVGAGGLVTGIDVSEKMVTLASLRAANGRRRATSSSSAATWRRPAPPTARSTPSPARSA